MYNISMCQITEWSLQIVCPSNLCKQQKSRLYRLTHSASLQQLTLMNHANLLLHNTGGSYPNLSKSHQLHNFPCLGGVDREEAEVYKSAHLNDGICGRLLCAYAQYSGWCCCRYCRCCWFNAL